MRISDWSSDVCSSDLTGQDLLPHSAALPKVVNRRPPGRGGFLEKTGGRTKGETAQIPPQELPQQLSGRSRTWQAKGLKWRCTGALEDAYVAEIFILPKASRPLRSKRRLYVTAVGRPVRANGRRSERRRVGKECSRT